MSSVITPSSAARSGPSRPRGGSTAQAPRSIDPFRVIRRHIWLLVASVVVGAGLGASAWYVLDKSYPLFSGEVRFELQPGLKQSREVGAVDFKGEDEVVRLGQTEMSMLLSRGVLREAVRTPQVENTEWIEQFVLSDGVSIDYEEAVDELSDSLNPGLIRNSNLFRLAWSTHVAEDVPVVLNRIAEAYINRRRQMDESRYRSNIEVFEEEMGNTADQIDRLTGEIDDFIRERGITALDDPRFHHTSLALNSIVQRMQEATVQLNVANTQYNRIQRKLEGTIRPTADDRMRAEQEGIIVQFDQQIAQSKAMLRSMRETRVDSSDSRVRELESRIRAFEDQRESKIQELIKRNLEADLKLTADRIQQLRHMLEEFDHRYEQQDAELRELAASYSEFKELERRRTFLEEQRSTDQALIRELNMLRIRDDASRVQIWQNAQIPRDKSFPQLRLMLPLGVVLTLGLTTGLVFLREMTDQRVKTVSDLGLIPGARVLGVIPDREEDPSRIKSVELVVRDQPSSVLAESYRQACAPLMKALDMSQHRSLLVLGSLPGSGTTTVVSNIATTYAATGRRVLVVDANFRRPGLAKALGAENNGAPGLGDLLHEATTLDEAIFEGGGDVDLLSCGTVPNRVFERLSTPRFDQLMAQLRDRYDLVILDAPPAVVAGESIALADKTDATLLVVPANEAQRGLVARLINQLSDTRSDLIGILLNRARGTTGGYFKKNFATIASYSHKSEA